MDKDIVDYLGTTPDAKEIDAATADVACKIETNLVSLYRQALWAAQNQEIAANRPVVEQFQTMWDVQIKAAEAYFQDHPKGG